MDIFTGYIVQSNETNPYSVWMPAKNGAVFFKSFKSLGNNAGPVNSIDLATVQAAAELCYMITEPTAQGGYLFDQESGVSTVEEYNPDPDMTTVRDIRRVQNITNTFSAAHDGECAASPHSYPAANGLQTYLPGSYLGTQINTYTNAPAGHHTTLDIGTRVLVVYPNGGGVGYIIGQIPFADETSKILKAISN